MDNSYTHSGIIQYHLDASLQADVLELTLSITEDGRKRKYKSFLMDGYLPTEIKKELKTVGNLFAVLEKNQNFKVDMMRGQIVLLLRRLELNEVVEKEVEIKLKFVREEEVKEEMLESKISEFGGEI